MMFPGRLSKKSPVREMLTEDGLGFEFYGQPDRKGKNTHQRKVASTHQKNKAHMHRNAMAATPIPMIRGLIFLFSTISPGATGLAGTLPA